MMTRKKTSRKKSRKKWPCCQYSRYLWRLAGIFLCLFINTYSFTFRKKKEKMKTHYKQNIVYKRGRKIAFNKNINRRPANEYYRIKMLLHTTILVPFFLNQKIYASWIDCRNKGNKPTRLNAYHGFQEWLTAIKIRTQVNRGPVIPGQISFTSSTCELIIRGRQDHEFFWIKNSHRKFFQW